MRKTKIILGLLLIFLLGMAAGALLALRLNGHHLRHGLPGPQPNVELIVQHLTHRLDLDDAQQRQTRAIVEDTRRQFEQLRDEKIGPESARILRDSDHRIRALLHPEQFVKFDVMVTERHPLPPDAMLPHHGLTSPDRSPTKHLLY